MIAKPLNDLTCRSKDVRRDWTQAHTDTFEALKHALSTTPVLIYPDMSKPFSLSVDASKWAGGAVLEQCPGPDEPPHPVSYWSMTFSREQVN